MINYEEKGQSSVAFDEVKEPEPSYMVDIIS
jgi:hypothetical protein